MISAGIDMGAKTIKVMVLKDGELAAQAIKLAGFDNRTAAAETTYGAAFRLRRVSGGRTVARINKIVAERNDLPRYTNSPN